MKTANILTISALCAFCALTAFSISTVGSEQTKTPELTEFSQPERNAPEEGMIFSSAHVYEEYEYDDAYCIVYDDPDCNVFNAEVCLDLDSYIKVIDAINANEELVGEFSVNTELSTPELTVWSIVENPEFEQAAASAKI